MSLVDIGRGIHIFVQDWGGGRPIVLLHGWPANHRIFEYHMMSLARRGFRAVAMDMRGFGYSDKPWEGNDYDTWANDVGAVLERLDLQDVLLVGYSMGGAIATHYVGSRQDPRVTQLGLIAAAAPTAAPTPELKKMYDTLIDGLQRDPAQPFQNYLAGLFTVIPASAAMLGMLIELSTQSSLWASIRGLEELRDRDLSDDLRAIQLPVKILHGAFDNTIPFPLAQEQQRLLPHATLVPYANSDHAIIFEQRERVVEELVDFANSHGIARAA